MKYKEQCDTCKWCGGQTCRRFPPQIIDHDGQWPPVKFKGWCGEYKINVNKLRRDEARKKEMEELKKGKIEAERRSPNG